MTTSEVIKDVVEIFLVEDNPGDVLLTREAFADARIINNINVAVDGEAAIHYLKKIRGYEDAITPDLILLDLNLPKKDGRQVLQEIKEDTYLRRIPVVILTSSMAERDVAKTYDLYANSYLVKPVSLNHFTEVVDIIENFWFSLAVLPPKNTKD